MSAVWDLRVPLLITISFLSTKQQAVRLQFLPRRLDYIWNLFTSLEKDLQTTLGQADYTRRHAAIDKSQFWLSCKDVPIPLQYPIGLIYDLFSEKNLNGAPLALNLHNASFPNDKLLALGATPNGMFDYYINMIKEADFIRNGSIQKVMSLSAQDQSTLWDSINTGDFTKFSLIMTQLSVFSTEESNSQIKSLPVRLYQTDGKVIRKLVNAQDTVHDLLQNANLLNVEQNSIVSHGIRLDPNTPLIWLAKNACFQDSFVHICLI